MDYTTAPWVAAIATHNAGASDSTLCQRCCLSARGSGAPRPGQVRETPHTKAQSYGANRGTKRRAAWAGCGDGTGPAGGRSRMLISVGTGGCGGWTPGWHRFCTTECGVVPCTWWVEEEMAIRRLVLSGPDTMEVGTHRRLWFDVWMWEATEAANASGPGNHSKHRCAHGR